MLEIQKVQLENALKFCYIYFVFVAIVFVFCSFFAVSTYINISSHGEMNIFLVSIELVFHVCLDFMQLIILTN